MPLKYVKILQIELLNIKVYLRDSTIELKVLLSLFWTPKVQKGSWVRMGANSSRSAQKDPEMFFLVNADCLKAENLLKL